MSNWSDHMVAGTGAQSFPLVHLQHQAYDSPFVKQPHGLPFRLLTELGLVGFALGYLTIASISTLSVLLVRSLRQRWERLAAAGIVGFSITYLVHSGYDWDWNMFALTSAYFFFSGICIGWYAVVRRRRPVRGRRYRT